MLPKSVDGFFVSNFYNILYLTGFKGLTPEERDGYLLLTRKNCYLFTDSRHEVKNFQFSIFNFQIRWITPEKRLSDHLKEIIREEKIMSLGFEEEDLKFAEYEQLKKKLKTKLVPVKNCFLEKREIKTSDEIGKIKKACEITDRCLGEIVKTIRVGQTEKEIAWGIEKWIKEKGYDLAFYPIVAVDRNSAVPHYDVRADGKAKIKKGSVLLIDFGVKYQNYCSDITRMFFVGRPTDEMTNVYEKLLSAQEKTLEHVGSQQPHPRSLPHIPPLTERRRSATLGPPVARLSNSVAEKLVSSPKQNPKCKDIDKYCRDQLGELARHFTHSTGHGVGLEIHEGPRLSTHSKDVLRAGQVVTVEPGVYITGRWGMRIEDTVLIGKNGEAIRLTKYPKDLQII